MQADDREDLDWLAFRYISGEMLAVEADAFEQRLVEDQTAREAVARSVEMAQAIASIPAMTLPMRKPARSWVQPVRWSVAAAAGLILVAGLYRSIHSSLETPTLASVWFKWGLRQAPFVFSDGDTLAGSEESPMIMAEEESELAIPAWLIEAVSNSLGEPLPDGHREDS